MNKSKILTQLLTQKGYQVDNVTWVSPAASGGVGIDGWTVEFKGRSPNGLHGFLGLNFESAKRRIGELPTNSLFVNQ